MPSATPSNAPITTLPTGVPTSTGWVSTVRASTIATSEMDQNTIDDYASEIANYYGVEASDVSILSNYETSGTLSLTIQDDVSESDLTDIIVSSIANSLGIHAKNVDVIIDTETGEVEFTIISDTFNDAAGVAFDLNNYQNENQIRSLIEDALPMVSVDDLNVADDVNMVLEITIDSNDAVNDLTQASWQSEQLLSDFDVTVESNQKFLNVGICID